MLLQYEIGVVGTQTVDRALASIERRFVTHQSRVNRTFGSTPRSAGAPGGAAAAARREGASAEREQQRQLAYWRNAHVQSQRARMREEDKRHRAAMRNSEKEARTAQALAKRALYERRRFVEGAFGKVSGSVRGTVGAVGRLGGAAMGLAGGFAVAGAIQERIRDTKMASQLANQAGNPALKGALLKESRGVRGMTSEQVLGGIGEFVTKTGDLDMGRKLTGSVSQLSLATGADFGDLMATAGQAFNVLKDQISDPVQLLGELNGVLGALAQQGAMGAVEIKDLAQDFGKLGAATRGFEGGAPELLRTMGAFAQIAVARGGAEGSADASTAAARLASDIAMPANRKRFGALGVGLKSTVDPTKLRDPLSIMLDVLDKTGGDVMKTSGLFGIESGKIFKGLSATYSEAEKKKKGTGRAAVTAEFNRFAGAKLSGKDIAARANSRLEDPDLRLQETVKELNAVLADKLLPVVMNLVPEFEKLLPYVEQGAKRFAQLSEAFAKDPIGGLMKLAAAKLAFDIAASTIADSGKRLASSLSGAASSVESAAGGGAGGPGGKLGAALLGAQLGITAASVILTASVVNFEKGEAEMGAGGKRVARARELAELAKTQALTPEQHRELRDLQLEQGKQVTASQTPGTLESMISGGISAAQYAGPVGWASKLFGLDPDKAASYLINPNKDTEVKTQQGFSKEVDLARIAAEQRSAAQAMKDAATALQAASGAGPNRGNAPSPIKG